MAKIIVISGASGLIGSHIQTLVNAKVIEVKTLNRFVSNNSITKKDLGNEKKSFWMNPEVLEGADAVIHLAGANVAEPWTKQHKKQILDSRIHGTTELIHAIANCTNPPKRLIAANAIGYYPDPFATELNEDSQPGDGFLAEVCKQWQQALYISPLENTEISVVRVGLVLAQDSKIIVASAMSYLLSGMVSIVGSKKNQWSWIHISDLSNLFISLANGDIKSGIYNGVAPAVVSQGDFGLAFENNPVIPHSIPKYLRAMLPMAKILNKAYGKFRMIIPIWAIKLLWGERSQIALTNQKISAQKTIQAGFVFQYPDINKALLDLSKK